MTQSAPSWQAIGTSVVGASHLRTGTVCQDALAISPGGGQRPLIVTVSDGHGGAAYVRSDTGSRLATEAAQRILDSFASDTHTLAADKVERMAADGLPREIVGYWRRLVLEHIRANPFSDSEREMVGAGDPQGFRAYGATLVALLVTSRYLLFLQLGDGDIVLVEQDGSVDSPLPDDPLVAGNSTTSLCQPDAETSVRVMVRGLNYAPPALVMLSSDGYANSYDADEFKAVAREYRDALQAHGPDKIAPELSNWMSTASAKGSGDDITLALVWQSTTAHAPAGAPPPPRPKAPPRAYQAPPMPGPKPRLNHVAQLVAALLLGGVAGAVANNYLPNVMGDVACSAGAKNTAPCKAEADKPPVGAKVDRNKDRKQDANKVVVAEPPPAEPPVTAKPDVQPAAPARQVQPSQPPPKPGRGPAATRGAKPNPASTARPIRPQVTGSALAADSTPPPVAAPQRPAPVVAAPAPQGDPPARPPAPPAHEP